MKSYKLYGALAHAKSPLPSQIANVVGYGTLKQEMARRRKAEDLGGKLGGSAPTSDE